MCLVFAAVGALGVVLLANAGWRAARLYLWDATPCRIVASTVVTDPWSDEHPYRFDVTYEYVMNGATLQSGVYTPSYQGGFDYGDALRLARSYPIGRQATCFVNASDPTETALDRPGLWLAPFVVIPLIFLVVGVAGLIGIWITPSREMLPRPAARIEERPWRGAWGEAVLYAVFFAAGVGLLFPVVIRPVSRWTESRSWPATPAVVVSSRVLVDDSGEDTSYRPDILFSYSAGGEQLMSNRLGFGTGSGGHSSAISLVDAHPDGAEVTCYVNPNDATDAVLVRKLPKIVYAGVIPIVFILVGGIGSVGAARKARRLRLEALFRH